MKSIFFLNLNSGKDLKFKSNFYLQIVIFGNSTGFPKTFVHVVLTSNIKYVKMLSITKYAHKPIKTIRHKVQNILITSLDERNNFKKLCMASLDKLFCNRFLIRTRSFRFIRILMSLRLEHVLFGLFGTVASFSTFSVFFDDIFQF